MKRIVITGPTGAIGMALIELCIQKEIEVLAICHKESKRAAQIPHSKLVQVIEADLDDYAQLDAHLLGKCDGFYHLAWNGTSGEARNDMLIQSQNIKCTMDAVNLAHRLGCELFIGAGSQAEYGRVEGKLNAEIPAWPENGYGIAKLCAGQMSREMCDRLNIRHIWTRILSVYGPYDGEQSMVSSAIRMFCEEGKGSFTKGEQQWDYLYSKDAAKIMLALGESGIHRKVYCLGSGSAKALCAYIEEIYDAVRKLYGSSPESAEQRKNHLGLGEIPYMAKQVMYLCADITELENDIGTIEFTPFEEGIRETIQNKILVLDKKKEMVQNKKDKQCTE